MSHASDAVSRRGFLAAATSVVGACGLGAAAIPFIQAMGPTRDIVEAGILEVDVSGMKEGELHVALWRKQPVYILRRTLEMIEKAARLDPKALQDPAEPGERAKKPEWLVCLGICTHLGCLPTLESGTLPDLDQPGFYCPCHGGKYDTLGRRLAGPPPENLHLVPYEFAGEGRIVIGTKTFAGYGENVRKISDLPGA